MVCPPQPSVLGTTVPWKGVSDHLARAGAAASPAPPPSFSIPSSSWVAALAQVPWAAHSIHDVWPPIRQSLAFQAGAQH
eukprot:1011444-Pyramimonas_sp.AAC.1